MLDNLQMKNLLVKLKLVHLHFNIDLHFNETRSHKEYKSITLKIVIHPNQIKDFY